MNYSNQAPTTLYGSQNEAQGQIENQYPSGNYGGYEAEEPDIENNEENQINNRPSNMTASQPSQQYRPQSLRPQGNAQAQKQGLQRSSFQQSQGPQRSFQQSQGLQRPVPKEQARVSAVPPLKKDEAEERRQNIKCFLGVTVVLLVLLAIGMAVLLTLWLSDGDDVTTTVYVNDTSSDKAKGLSPTPTPAPVQDSSNWTFRTELESTSGQDVAFGASLAVVGNLLAVGVPEFGDSAGRIQVYEQSGTSGSFTPLNVASTTNTEEFGGALDIAIDAQNTPRLLVGARRSLGAVQTSVNFGTAHYFTYDGSSWELVGDAIRSSESIEEAGGGMGEAVAMASTIDRIAVAAPSSSSDENTLNTGSVYTFELSGSNWNPMTASPLRGDSESFFGQSIDMSEDGNNLLVGAPGDAEVPTNGKVVYYQWDEGSSSWTELFSLDGTDSESLGSSVRIISSDGSRFAAGSRRGIRVFALNSATDEFEQLGNNDIVGLPSDGDNHVVTAFAARNGTIVIGTDTGRVGFFDFDGTSWNRAGDGTSSGPAIRSMAMTDDGNAVIVGLANERIAVYDRNGV